MKPRSRGLKKKNIDEVKEIKKMEWRNEIKNEWRTEKGRTPRNFKKEKKNNEIKNKWMTEKKKNTEEVKNIKKEWNQEWMKDLKKI